MAKKKAKDYLDSLDQRTLPDGITHVHKDRAEVVFGDDAPVWGTELHTISVPLLVIPEWCACENRDAERDGYCADCGGKIRQS